ncbi:hypothetical protein TOPH_03052 [Tolypocladium ophioglossoides CBS 100239]|uniref:Aminoglycoside phosphotransferase domain-containing protein n=1 Tax=Tolypocladium ophioglossoides (strain CBS 100239) TaxID=1163406 RepID=A0A0L0NDD2_TOLOC|nr:hypothetical protein TOPH_03052 [Tolypocladium ophioglossoides CBS 100239]
MYLADTWPKTPDGTDFDGKQLFSQVRNGKSPFDGAWDVNLLIREIEENLGAEVTDIPFVYNGSNNYHVGPRLDRPGDIMGRRLLMFERTDGEKYIWHDLSPEQRACLLTQSACIRASLFNFQLPLDFAAVWLRERLFEQKPRSLPIPVAPTREICVALFTAKIEATIRNIGDMIGWENDNNTVGPIAVVAKQSLLRLIPYIMPADSSQSSLPSRSRPRRFWYPQHVHYMDANNNPLATSLYDWETGCIVPAILSDPLMAVVVDLVTDENANPSITRVPSDATPSDRVQYMEWTRHYFGALLNQAPTYERAIQAGKDARHLWFALRERRGEDPEGCSVIWKLG